MANFVPDKVRHCDLPMLDHETARSTLALWRPDCIDAFIEDIAPGDEFTRLVRVALDPQIPKSRGLTNINSLLEWFDTLTTHLGELFGFGVIPHTWALVDENHQPDKRLASSRYIQELYDLNHIYFSSHSKHAAEVLLPKGTSLVATAVPKISGEHLVDVYTEEDMISIIPDSILEKVEEEHPIGSVIWPDFSEYQILVENKTDVWTMVDIEPWAALRIGGSLLSVQNTNIE